jgi:hypothetical protein
LEIWELGKKLRSPDNEKGKSELKNFV